MIYNGFQARILDVNHEPLAEVMPEPGFDKEEAEKRKQERRGSSLEQYTALFGQKVVKDYKPILRKEALQNVRCGAVRVKVDDDNSTRGAESDEESIREQHQSSSRKVCTTRLFLAFRWVGTDHRNATRAHELEELHHTILPILHGKGLQEEGQSKTLLAKYDESTAPKEDIPDKKSDRKKYRLFGRLKLGEKGREIEKAVLIKGQPLPRYRTFSLKSKKSMQESHPFLLQLCVDEKVIPLRKNAWTADLCENDGVMIVWLSEGAMIDLGRISISLNDLKDIQSKTVQSVTLHLWDAMRKELWSNAVTFTMTGNSGLVYPTCDIRNISPPNAILHFNIIAFKNMNNVGDQAPAQIKSPIEEVPIPNEATSQDSQVHPLDQNNGLSRALAIVIETSQEHSLSSAIEGTSDHTVEDEIASESTPKPNEENGASDETHLPRVGVIPQRRSSLATRSRTNSLQATVQTHDRSQQPISQLFEEVDRLRFEHEHLKESLSALDGQWRDSVLVELQKIKGEIRDRVEIDRDYYNKLKKRFSVPPETFSQLNK
ncbi:uncharacterized protein FA14DRAFT_153917 [Meira miltonrushii]|uniref:Uncharacterized protein n=1 Tax=Meira miltonrushii TaxID=1280837 RepID=A0A316VM33_9BASI|nr:uncharacterized protein FA14DRAFT_153917 [Meira miltonrushii]PWN38597.1 hypothetical protein FA14DRAFT_153917 [Meira miltonrushii]